MEIQSSTVIVKSKILKHDVSTKNIEKDKFQQICTEKDGRKGKPIPGFAREIILKVSSVVEQEAKNDRTIYPLNSPTKRAALYTGVSERTVQRIRNENKKRKMQEIGDCSSNSNKKCMLGRDEPKDESSYFTMKRKSKKGQTIPLSARNIISRVIEACDNEHRDGEYVVPLFICTSKRTALYTGVSQRTVQRIKNEDERRSKINEDVILRTPGKKRKRSKFSDKIDDFDFFSIRNFIDDLILVKKMYPSCSYLHSVVKEKFQFPYSENTLYRLLHSKGFGWYKGPKGKRILIEKPEVFKGRFDYLRKIKECEELGKFIVYFDAKSIGRDKIEDFNDSSGIFSLKGGLCSSGRLVIMHEYSPLGFLKRVEQLFAPSLIDSEEKPDIQTVEKWMMDKFFPNLPPNSIIILTTDKSKMDDKIPNEYSSKQSLIKFLKENHLEHKSTQTCLDLYGIIEKFLESSPQESSEIDSIIGKHGHKVLRLPPYMSEFSPIELAWADIKRFVRNKNPSGKTSSKFIRDITLEALSCLQDETLHGYVSHVIQMEDYFWDKQKLIQEHYDNVMNKSTPNCSRNGVTNGNGTSPNFANNVNSLISDSSVILHEASVNNLICAAYEPMLPHGQLTYGLNVATSVPEKLAVIGETQDVIEAPSYFNL